MRESVKSWADEIKTGRCKSGEVSTELVPVGEVLFYVVEAKFDALRDETERMYFKRLPTAIVTTDRIIMAVFNADAKVEKIPRKELARRKLIDQKT